MGMKDVIWISVDDISPSTLFLYLEKVEGGEAWTF